MLRLLEVHFYKYVEYELGSSLRVAAQKLATCTYFKRVLVLPRDTSGGCFC